MAAVNAYAVAPTDLTPEQQSRYIHIISELRCLVCQNQTIADSNAELAVDLRDRVHSQILAGKTDAEILDYMTQRYGDFVLYRPPLKAKTIALWAGPFLLLTIALAGLWTFSRRSRKSVVVHAAKSNDASAVDAEVKNILDKLDS